jgi:integrase
MEGAMARTVKDSRLDTKAAREGLKARSEPHWRALEMGLHLGYRKRGLGGSWVARRRKANEASGSRYVETKIGLADDLADADGVRVFDFSQAQSKARAWVRAAEIAAAGGVDPDKPYTVGNALDDYLDNYITEGGKAEYEARRTIDVLIRPVLGAIPLPKLTHMQVKGFRNELAKTGRRLRTREGEEPKFAKVAPKDAEQQRKRRATANRIFTTLRAALNHAYQNQKIASNAAWAGVKPFENTDAPRVRYLLDDDALRLVNACEPSFRAMVTAALLTGCRYGELVRMRAADFDRDTGLLHIPLTKSGNPRDVILTDEGREFLSQATLGKAPDALVFVRSNGKAWKAAEQTRPLRAACKAAKIAPAVSFHILRHTYASRLARAGVPMAVIAAQLGHADLRVTSRHYAHLSPGYVADTVRAAFGSMGLVDMKPGNVVEIRKV